MELEQNVIYFDRPTINGHTYTAECFASVPDLLWVTFDREPDGALSLDAVIGRIDRIVVEQDAATIHWHTLATPMGRLFDQMPVPRSYGFSPVGIGLLNGGQVTKYQLSHFAIITNSLYQ